MSSDRILSIRAAATQDLGPLVELDAEVFGLISYPYFVFRQFYDLCPGGLLVATLDDLVCGYALVAQVLGSRRAYFVSLGVSPGSRGQGIGRSLAEAGLEFARSNGFDSIKLSVEPSNAAAIALYRSLGFVQVGEDLTFFGADGSRLIMQSALS